MPGCKQRAIKSITGSQQSPIQIWSDQTFESSLSPVDIVYRVSQLNGSFQKEDHVNGTHASFNLSSDEQLLLNYGRDQAKLVQIHFHSPSEHMINEQRYDVEMHFVHDICDDKTAPAALNASSKLEPSRKIVVAVFAQCPELEVPSSSSSVVLESQLAVNLSKLSTTKVILEEDKRAEHLGITEQSFQDMQRACSKYFFYRGSLTSGDHEEFVSWIVPTSAIKLTPSDQRAIRSIGQTTREIQPLNRRIVLTSI